MYKYSHKMIVKYCAVVNCGWYFRLGFWVHVLSWVFQAMRWGGGVFSRAAYFISFLWYGVLYSNGE